VRHGSFYFIFEGTRHPLGLYLPSSLAAVASNVSGIIVLGYTCKRLALAFDKLCALEFELKRIAWNTNGTNVLLAEGAGIALIAREPATVASVKDALEPGDARTAKEPAANRRRPPVKQVTTWPVRYDN
jgi:hypothetical protein